MEIDSPSSMGDENRILKIHPLPIIEISDHHTRVTNGGSPVSPEFPIIGLLFGYEEQSTTCIVDAQEIEYTYSTIEKETFGGGTAEEQKSFRENIRTKIELHNLVFPTHKVVGWYRVANNGDPTPNDLMISNGPIQKLSESPIFLLMNTNANSTDTATATDTLYASGATSDDAEISKEAEDDDEDDEAQLPIFTFETVVNNLGEAVFVNIDFELETFEPERIAVEKVLKTPPTSSNDEHEISALDLQLQELQSSIRSMDARVEILLDFLCKTRDGVIPPNHKLLREVDCVLKQLPIVAPQMELYQQFDKDYNQSLILAYLASIAKTVKTIEGHTEKFRKRRTY